MSKNLKILLSVFGFLVLLGGIGGGIYLVQQNQTLQEGAAPATNFSITPTSQTKNPGETVTFAVVADTQSNLLAAIDLDIVYDPNILTINSLEKGSFAANFDVVAPANNSVAGHYKYHIGNQDPAKALNGSGEIAVISATIKADAPAGGATNLSFGSGTIAAGIGENGVNVLVGRSGAQLTVSGVVEASPVSSSAPTPAITPAPATPLTSASPAASTPATPIPSSTPIASASPRLTPAGGVQSPSPSVAASPVVSSTPRASTVASSTPVASTAPAAGQPASSPRASSSPVASSVGVAASSKPTVTIPTSGSIVAGSTISGTAAPNSTVTIVIRSKTVTATVKADATGKWSYKMPTDLENGSHTITITDSKGTTTKSFKLTGGTTATASASVAQLPDAGGIIPTIFGISLGILLLIAGLVLAL